jgi:4-hydroxy-4-methyl-2-oxoglutarate aldolase
MHSLDPNGRVSDADVHAFQLLAPASIGHITHVGFVSPNIRPVFPVGRIIAGRAVTLCLTAGDTSRTREAIASLRPGDVLMIDQRSESAAACWGEMTARDACNHGASGVIIDGLCTDIVEVASIGVPTFSRGIAALVGRRLGLDGGVGQTVQIGGATVNPGDLVVADDNGIVVIGPLRVGEIRAAAELYEALEPKIRAWLGEGRSLLEWGELTPADIERLRS